jgi:methyl-accepting chemotaxis protein
VRNENGKTVFVIDTDESSRQAMPGKVYNKGISALEAGFKRPSVDDHFYTDEWGVFMAGYAPVDADGGPYVVGMDMRADEVQRKYKRLQLSGLISLFASLVLALLFSRVLAQRLVRHIGAFVRQCEAIASGSYETKLELKTGDELDQLVNAFNTMAVNLSRTQASLHHANADLELRVQQRTQELTASNEELKLALENVKQLTGLLPMCAWCKKMRDDDGYWTELERYVEQQAGVKFTHGICPDCAHKLIQNDGQAPQKSRRP